MCFYILFRTQCSSKYHKPKTIAHANIKYAINMLVPREVQWTWRESLTAFKINDKSTRNNLKLARTWEEKVIWKHLALCLASKNYFNFHVPKDKTKFIPFSTAIMRLLLSSLWLRCLKSNVTTILRPWSLMLLSPWAIVGSHFKKQK